MSRDFNPFVSPQTMATDRPEMIWAAESPEALQKVKLGLTMVYGGICGILLCCIGFPVVVVGIGMEGGPETMLLLSHVMTGLMLLLAIVMFIGQLFCLAVPSESGAKPLIIAAVCLQGLGFLGALSGFLITSGTIGIVLSAVLNLAGVASMVCFILFMRQVAKYIQRYDVAGRAVRALIVGGVSVVAIVAYAITEEPSPDTMVVIPALGMIVGLVMYANTVTYLRRAITV